MLYKSCFIIFLSLTGCANLSTVNRKSDLPTGSVAIHLDSAQRLVYENSEGYLCAEPTPDALQSYANAFGGSATTGGKDAASLSNAFTANALGVGLHTQSITLMRDVLYRICEQSYNKRLLDIDVNQQLLRAQDLTLGVLAIEQLTGAVTPRQPLIVNTASASSANAINDAQAQADIAKRNEVAKKAGLDAATLEEEKAKTDLATAKSFLAEEAGKDAADQNAEKIKNLTAQVSSLEGKLTSKTASKQDAEISYKNAIAATKAIEAMANAYVNNTTASTGGIGIVSDTSPRTAFDKDAIKELSKATVSIIQAVINKGRLTDSCVTFYSRVMNGKAPGLTPHLFDEITGLCGKVIEADIKNRELYYHAMLAKNTPEPLTNVTPTQPYVPARANAPVLGDGSDLGLLMMQKEPKKKSKAGKKKPKSGR